jgi:outer membrane lipoprotein-sorting protein
MSASLGPRRAQAFPIAAAVLFAALLAIAAAGLFAALFAAGCAQSTDARPHTENRLPPETATDVLQRVVEAYHQADRYRDDGRLVVRYRREGEPFSETSDFSLALAGPNQLRIRAYDVLAVCDGQKFLAAIDGAPDEVLSLAVPDELSLMSVFADPVLAKALNQIVGSIPLSLFLDPDPLPALLINARTPELSSPEKIGANDCYRVRIQQHEGTLVLWVDERTFVVRRIEYPVGGYLRLVEPYPGAITEMTITAELEGAELDPPIDDATFEFEVPKNAELVRQLDAVREGARIPKFKLQAIDGQVITRDSLSGKIAVIKFWQLDDLWRFCDDLSEFEQIQRRFQGEKSMVFLAVTADPEEISDDELRAAFAKAGVSLPIARIEFEKAFRSFGLDIVPTTVILGPDGTLQERMVGTYPNQATSLPKKLGTLLAGGDLTLEAPEAPPDTVIFAGAGWQDTKGPEENRQSPLAAALAEAPTAPPSEPAWLGLKRVWVCSEVTRPGNLLVVPEDAGHDRVFVVEGAPSVAEIDAQGKLTARHTLDLPGAESGAVAFLRTGIDGSGKRYFLGSTSGAQQVHLFDADWNRQVSFPEAGSHPGIADALLADLDGDGELEMAVGYLKEVGVHLVTLDGERLWGNRAAEEVLRLDVTGPDRSGQRGLLVADGLVLPINSAGDDQPPFPVADAFVRRVFTADLDGDDNRECCAIALEWLRPGEPTTNVAVGLSPRGRELWRHPLPKGMHRHASLEMVAAGNLLGGDAGPGDAGPGDAGPGDAGPGETGQWVIVASDGSIHILATDGTLIDRFNYGTAPTGIAIAKLDGHPTLLVSTPDRVEAWQFRVPNP